MGANQHLQNQAIKTRFRQKYNVQLSNADLDEYKIRVTKNVNKYAIFGFIPMVLVIIYLILWATETITTDEFLPAFITGMIFMAAGMIFIAVLTIKFEKNFVNYLKEKQQMTGSPTTSPISTSMTTSIPTIPSHVTTETTMVPLVPTSNGAQTRIETIENTTVAYRNITDAERTQLKGFTKTGGLKKKKQIGAVFSIAIIIFMITSLATSNMTVSIIALVLTIYGMIINSSVLIGEGAINNSISNGLVYEAYGVPEIKHLRGVLSLVTIGGISFEVNQKQMVYFPEKCLNKIAFTDGGMGLPNNKKMHKIIPKFQMLTKTHFLGVIINWNDVQPNRLEYLPVKAGFVGFEEIITQTKAQRAQRTQRTQSAHSDGGLKK